MLLSLVFFSIIYCVRTQISGGSTCGCPSAPSCPTLNINVPQVNLPTLPAPCLPPLPQIQLPAPCLPPLPKIDIPTLICLPPPCPVTLPPLPPPTLCPIITVPQLAQINIQTCGCGRKKRETGLLPIFNGNSTSELCTNNMIKQIIMRNLNPSPAKSKAKIHSEIKFRLGGNYVVTCSQESLSFIADAFNYCVAGDDNQSCYVFEL